MTTLITEPNDYASKALAIYRSLGSVCLLPELGARREAVLAKTDILVVRLGHYLDRPFLDRFRNLKIIASPTTGLNHIDLDYVRRRKIRLITLRGRTSFLKDIPSTAEETIALMLSLVRNIPWAFDDVKKGHWNRDAFRGHQLAGKTLGIVGFGRLGRLVARYARALGMAVLATDPALSENAMARRGVSCVALKTLLKSADVVSLHAALDAKTRGLLGEKDLSLMRPDAYLINTARAELIAEGALLKALEGRWIAGAATDVLWNEEKGVTHLRRDPLIAYAKTQRNLIIVPHIGGATIEAMARTEEFIAELVKTYVTSRAAHTL
ncbi:MAG: NAD(P)-dependent oxidoreductase [bacterium]|nr:NAD(P)-dependent oxidoreductase [bacterium]MDZ4296348.1 NAD(P)-dependent oxidoreductase [Patescibacteria group bacterium]